MNEHKQSKLKLVGMAIGLYAVQILLGMISMHVITGHADFIGQMANSFLQLVNTSFWIVLVAAVAIVLLVFSVRLVLKLLWIICAVIGVVLVFSNQVLLGVAFLVGAVFAYNYLADL